MSNNTGNTMVALLAGAVIGAGLGILFAPDKGTKTRKKIKGGLEDAKKEIAHRYQDATEELKKKFTNAKYDLEETYDHLVSNMSHKGEDVIAFLEEKLANLKEQNAKLQK